MKARNKIFISHTAKEADNFFASWLNAKLKIAGYDSWCELDRFKGGEECWQEIEPVIRKETSVAVIVISTAYVEKLLKGKSGIRKELNLIEKTKEIPVGNIVPVIIDDISINDLPIELNAYWTLDASKNWALALGGLLEKFTKINLKKAQESQDVVSSWFSSAYEQKHKVYGKEETLFTNWWEINTLPKSIYMYEYHNEAQAINVIRNTERFPVIRHGKWLGCFHNQIEPIVFSDIEDTEVYPQRVITISIQDILSDTFKNIDYPTLDDSKYLLIRLLNKALHNHFSCLDLSYHEMSNGKLCYFFQKDQLEKDKVKFLYPNGGDRTKNLVGKYYGHHWHFGISSRAILEPFPSFSLKMHILFSDDGKRIWSDKSKSHTARRRKGKTWFNDEWRDQLLAFINAVAELGGNTVTIPMNHEHSIKMPRMTLTLDADFGYDDPTDSSRLSALASEDEEDEYYEEK